MGKALHGQKKRERVLERIKQMKQQKARFYDGCGVKVSSGQIGYQYPAGHPCHGCPYTFVSKNPGCIMGSKPGNCTWYFYKELINKRESAAALENSRTQE